MKKFIFFDVDNTIYHNASGTILSQTKKLLTELSKKEDVILGLATGRGMSKLDIIEDVLPFFTYKVLINGSVIYKGDELINHQPILKEDIEELLSIANSNDYNVGMVGLSDEAVNYWDKRVEDGMTLLRGHCPRVDKDFYLKYPIYQFWMFADSEEKILELAKKIDKFACYPWHKFGADFIYPSINKAYGIQKALENETDYELICVGDGANDIHMIELADIGIAMNNSRFDQLKEKADLIAPAIDENQLYDFFKANHLI